jgi:hypothetical protein
MLSGSWIRLRMFLYYGDRVSYVGPNDDTIHLACKGTQFENSYPFILYFLLVFDKQADCALSTDPQS